VHAHARELSFAFQGREVAGEGASLAPRVPITNHWVAQVAHEETKISAEPPTPPSALEAHSGELHGTVGRGAVKAGCQHHLRSQHTRADCCASDATLDVARRPVHTPDTTQIRFARFLTSVAILALLLLLLPFLLLPVPAILPD
jgi:hypothetical protein